MRISREKTSISDNSQLIKIKEEYPDHSFFYINFHIAKSSDVYSALKKLSAYLEDHQLEVLLAFGFGFKSHFNKGELEKMIPLILLYHNYSKGHHVQLICTDSKHVKLREYSGDTCVKSLDNYGSELYFISNVTSNEQGDYYRKAYSTFMALKRILEKNDISYSGLARTWLYIDNILDWYDELNHARTNFYNEENIFDGFIPASTGIGLSNLNGKSLSISAYALREGKDDCIIRMIESPLQCPATDYKSSFSRAVEISFNTSKRLIISGTASINSRGETLHKDSIEKQIEHTMEVVKSIMINEQYGWDNVVRSIAYFPATKVEKYFINYCMLNNIDSSYIMAVNGTVCRDDLLFEIELDAVKPVQH